MDFAKMKRRVRILLGETDPDNTYFPTTEIAEVLNDSQAYVAMEIPEILTFHNYTTVVGEQRYAIEPEILIVVAVQLYTALNQVKRLVYKPKDRFDEIIATNYTLQGEPEFYTIERGQVALDVDTPGDIWLYPLPNAALAMRVYGKQRPSTMTLDGDVSELPQYLHLALCYHAAADLSLKQQEGALHDRLMAKYNIAIDRAKSLYHPDQEDSFETTHDEMGYGTDWGDDD